MKEAITKFDLEAAFKALDEIDIPKTGRVKANKPALTEIFSRKTKLDALMEEYYDIGNPAELEDAQEAREAEVAKAKLARIEKIVDLDADSPEDLLTSYVGKYIMQCPQCMTLFYKNQEDIVEAEDDPNTVNVNEVCQHCGNETGYTLVGKVGEAEPGEFEPEGAELPTDDLATEEIPEDPAEEPVEDTELEDLDDLDSLDLDLDLDAEEEKTEESFTQHTGEMLVEEITDDKELDAKLDAHNEYIEYLRAAIAQEEEKLEKATNEQVKVAIQRNIDAFKADLENALPDAVKNDITVMPAEETPVDGEQIEEPAAAEEAVDEEPEKQEEALTNAGDTLVESLTEASSDDIDVSEAEFKELLNTELRKPITDAEVMAILASDDESVKDDSKNEAFDAAMNTMDELQESVLESYISMSLIESYANVVGFRLKECAYAGGKFTVDGTIHFTSGNTRNTTYVFNECYNNEGKLEMRGLNEKLGLDKQFTLTGCADSNRCFITESFTCTKK